jgi:hypothetical protein
MKTLRTVTLLLLMGLAANPAIAQSNSKNNFFKSLPEKTQVAIATLATSMELKEGSEMSIKLAEGLEFKGKVISNIQKYHNLRSVLIQSENMENTVFQISAQLNDDKTISYVGKILSQGSAEGLKLSTDDKGNYFLTKFETSNILQDCSYTH